MACEACTHTQPVTRCNTIINLGTYGTNGTDLYIYFENLATGKERRVSATSGGAGELAITHSLEFTPNTTYKIWMNEQSANKSEEAQWTLPDATTTPSCVLVQFEDVYDNAGARVAQTTVDIQV